METQKSITEWAVDTFGEKHPVFTASRMMKEVVELNEALVAVSQIPVSLISSKMMETLVSEVADVEIMLRQIAESLSIDLDSSVDAKMQINRKRNWVANEFGSFQHEPETFLEPGTGLRMRKDRWYIISDSGSYYSTQGFEHPRDAVGWIENFTRKEFELPATEPSVPVYNPISKSWLEMSGCNIVYGLDMFEFWQDSDAEIFNEAQA